jgi:hypothetical protein
VPQKPLQVRLTPPTAHPPRKPDNAADAHGCTDGPTRAGIHPAPGHIQPSLTPPPTETPSSTARCPRARSSKHTHPPRARRAPLLRSQLVTAIPHPLLMRAPCIDAPPARFHPLCAAPAPIHPTRPASPRPMSAYAAARSTKGMGGATCGFARAHTPDVCRATITTNKRRRERLANPSSVTEPGNPASRRRCRAHWETG